MRQDLSDPHIIYVCMMHSWAIQSEEDSFMFPGSKHTSSIDLLRMYDNQAVANRSHSTIVYRLYISRISYIAVNAQGAFAFDLRLPCGRIAKSGPYK